MGDLTTAEGGVVTGLGKFQAGLRNSSMMLRGTCETSVGTKGTVTVPVAEGKQVMKLMVNGTKMHLEAAGLAAEVQYATSVFGEGLVTLEVAGGSGSIEVVYT
jgi:hypothetical protein